ncbi:MAG: hypothetical protein AAGD47_12485 [Pseudomonadota bacterium]
MSGDLQRLLFLHDLASPFGCGLKPELENLLRARSGASAKGAIPMPVLMHSAGPAEQHATQEQLRSEGISVLRPPASADTQPPTDDIGLDVTSATDGG